ncbi:MAG TPA: hypothetical protein VFP84_28635 [Kofleriaceae bacterium]|nr:hypothetical protein [Kofleriaceae bacterium]
MTEPVDPEVAPEVVEIHRRLVAAWWSLGVSGLLLLLSIAIFSGNPRHPASSIVGMASLGAVLGTGGALVVRRSRRELLAAAAGRILPIARVV